ncbi:MAG: hypothetical protein EZS28_052719, partial [Streblomastix strix]
VIVWRALQFFAVFLTAIHSKPSRRVSSGSSSGRVLILPSGVKFYRVCDMLAAKMCEKVFQPLLVLLSPNYSSRVNSLAAACLSCFGELGYRWKYVI